MQHSRSTSLADPTVPRVALSNPEAFEQHRVSGRRERQQAAAFPRGDDSTSATSTAGKRLRVDLAAQASGLVNPRVAGDRGEHRPRL